MPAPATSADSSETSSAPVPLPRTVTKRLNAVVKRLPPLVRNLLKLWSVASAYIVGYFAHSVLTFIEQSGPGAVLFPRWIITLYDTYPAPFLTFTIVGLILLPFGAYIQQYELANRGSLRARNRYLRQVVREPARLDLATGPGPLNMPMIGRPLQRRPPQPHARLARLARLLMPRFLSGDLSSAEGLRAIVIPGRLVAMLRGPRFDRLLVRRITNTSAARRKAQGAANSLRLVTEKGPLEALRRSSRRWGPAGGGRPQMMVLCESGSEARTFLKYLVQQQAHDAQARPAALIPIYLSLAEMRESTRPDRSIEDYLEQRERELGIADSQGRDHPLFKWMRDGDVLFCFDAAYEDSLHGSPTARELPDGLLAQICNLPGGVVFATRKDASDMILAEARTYATWELMPLQEARREEYVKSLFQALVQRSATDRGGRGRRLARQPSSAEATSDELAASFFQEYNQRGEQAEWSEIEPSGQVGALVEIYYQDETLPANVVAFYYQYAEATLRHAHIEDRLQQHTRRHSAAAVALQLTELGQRECSGSDLIAILLDRLHVPPAQAPDLAHQLVDAGLLEQVRSDVYRFPDNAPQEFFTAIALARDTMRGGTLAWDRRASDEFVGILPLMLGYMAQYMGQEGSAAASLWHDRVKAWAKDEVDPAALIFALDVLRHIPEPAKAWGTGFTTWEAEVVRQWVDDLTVALRVYDAARLARLLAMGRAFAILDSDALQGVHTSALAWLDGADLHAKLVGALVLGALAGPRRPEIATEMTTRLQDDKTPWPVVVALILETGMLGSHAPDEAITAIEHLAREHPNTIVRLVATVALYLPDVRVIPDRDALLQRFTERLPPVLRGLVAQWLAIVSQDETSQRLRRWVESGTWIGPCAPVMALISLLKDQPAVAHVTLRDEPDSLLGAATLAAAGLMGIFDAGVRAEYHEDILTALADHGDTHRHLIAAALAPFLGIKAVDLDVSAARVRDQSAAIRLVTVLVAMLATSTPADEKTLRHALLDDPNPFVALATCISLIWVTVRGWYEIGWSQAADDSDDYMDYVRRFGLLATGTGRSLVALAERALGMAGLFASLQERGAPKFLWDYLGDYLGANLPLLLAPRTPRQQARRLRQDIAYLTRTLRDRDALVRAEALVLLGLMAWLESVAPDTRTHVPLKPIVKGLRDRDADVRGTASVVLTLVADAELRRPAERQSSLRIAQRVRLRDLRGLARDHEAAVRFLSVSGLTYLVGLDRRQGSGHESGRLRGQLAAADFAEIEKHERDPWTQMLATFGEAMLWDGRGPRLGERVEVLLRQGTVAQSLAVLGMFDLSERWHVLLREEIGLAPASALEHPNSLVNIAAVAYLGQRRAALGVAPLEHALTHGNPWVRATALATLSTNGALTSPALERAARDDAPAVRALAAWSLTQQTDAPLEAARPLLADAKVYVRLTTVTGLARRNIQGQEWLPEKSPLRQAWQSMREDLSQTADPAPQESSQGRTEGFGVPGRTADLLALTLRAVRRARTWAQSQRDAALAALPAAAAGEPAREPEPARDGSAQALAPTATKTATVADLLLQAMDDADARVRLSAILGLAHDHTIDRAAFREKAWHDKHSLVRLAALIADSPDDAEWETLLREGLVGDDPALRMLGALVHGLRGDLAQQDLERLAFDDTWFVRQTALGIGSSRLTDGDLLQLFEHAEDVGSRVIAAMESIARESGRENSAAPESAGGTSHSIHGSHSRDPLVSDPAAISLLIYKTFGAEGAARVGVLPFLAGLGMVESLVTLPMRDATSWRTRVLGVALYGAWSPLPLSANTPSVVADDREPAVQDALAHVSRLLQTYEVADGWDLTIVYLQGDLQRRLLRWFARWLVTYGAFIEQWDEQLEHAGNLLKLLDELRRYVQRHDAPIFAVIEQALDKHLDRRALLDRLLELLGVDQRGEVRAAVLIALAGIPTELSEEDIEVVRGCWRSDTSAEVREAARDVLLAVQ